MTDHLDPSDPASSPSPDQWDAVARYLAGEASAGDAADVRQWLSEHPRDAHVVAALDGILPPSATDAALSQNTGTLQFGKPIDVEAALRRVHAQMETAVSAPALTVAGEKRKTPVTSRRPVQPSRSWTGAVWAAAAAVIAVVGITQFRSGGESAPTVAQVYSTPVGASDTVVLADSSEVILAPGSRLTVAAAYGKDDRSVELNGAAQFTVHHDEKRPFSVRAGSALVKDIGTVFTVNAVPEIGVVVAVTEGEVALSDSSASGQAKAVNLVAGDRGRLKLDGTVVAERGSVTPDELGWVVGKLTWRGASWAEVQADLRRWYGVELSVTDSVLRSRTISSDAKVGEDVAGVVNKMAMGIGGVATKRGDTVFVEKAGDRPKH